MKVVFVVSHIPGQFCGVVDYTDKLCSAMLEAGIDAHVEKVTRWSFENIFEVRRKYSGEKNIIYHLQYPALGMGHSILPGFLPVFLWPGRTITTLHEFSVFNVFRKAIFLPLSLLSKIIFTHEYERSFFLKTIPCAIAGTSVIPIGNNITPVPQDSARENKIIYFGQITEGKGIEEFLEVARSLRSHSSGLKLAIAGAVMDENSQIFKAVSKAAQEGLIEFRKGLLGDEVSRLLQTAKIAFLPFPDGISDKRGSAIACMKHDLVVVTRHSDKTPEWMKRTTYAVKDANEAAELMISLIQKDVLQSPSPEMIGQELEMREWRNIVTKHMQVYKA